MTSCYRNGYPTFAELPMRKEADTTEKEPVFHSFSSHQHPFFLVPLHMPGKQIIEKGGEKKIRIHEIHMS